MRAGMPAVLHALRFLGVAFFLLGCGIPEEAATAPQPVTFKIPNSQLEPLSWADLDGWPDDDHAAAFKTFMVSCAALLPHAGQTRDAPPMLDALIQVCRRAAALQPGGKEQARAFFEKNFRPLAITPLGENAGFLTAYYEPIVQGSRTWSVDYQFPLYRKPSNLVSRRGRLEGFPNKGEVGRRFGRRKIVPYYDRAEIENGILTGRQLEICWLKDPLDAMFIQIQGSARIALTDGSMMRVNYDAHNGYPYSPVGKFLIENGAIPRGEMSMDRIRQWMQANPEQGREIRGKNRSFVFFREVNDLGPNDEPKGAQGVSLTPGRSIAVDDALHVYGTPFFIQADLPIDSVEPTTKFRRLMISQDTGSAIVGPARADLYFGAGDAAGKIAGRLKQPGRFAMLVPRELDIFEPGRQRVPLPLPRLAHMAEKEQAKDKTEPVPLPRPRPKIEATR